MGGTGLVTLEWCESCLLSGVVEIVTTGREKVGPYPPQLSTEIRVGGGGQGDGELVRWEVVGREMGLK